RSPWWPSSATPCATRSRAWPASCPVRPRARTSPLPRPLPRLRATMRAPRKAPTWPSTTTPSATEALPAPARLPDPGQAAHAPRHVRAARGAAPEGPDRSASTPVPVGIERHESQEVVMVVTTVGRGPRKAGQRGQGMTEYIIIVALIAIAAITVVAFFGDTVRNQVAGMASELSGTSASENITAAQQAASEARV